MPEQLYLTPDSAKYFNRFKNLTNDLKQQISRLEDLAGIIQNDSIPVEMLEIKEFLSLVKSNSDLLIVKSKEYQENLISLTKEICTEILQRPALENSTKEQIFARNFEISNQVSLDEQVWIDYMSSDDSGQTNDQNYEDIPY